MSRVSSLFLIVAGVVALNGGSAIAQTPSGRITGSVRAQGAGLAGARVTATNRATGGSRGATTTADGAYSIGGLASGTYTVVNGMFIRGWDLPDNKKLFRASGTVAGAPAGGLIDDGLSYGAYKHIREHGKAADYAAYLYQNRRLGTSQATAVYSSGWLVSDNFIEAMRIPMSQGPGFAGTKASDGARVVLTDKLWKTAFDGDRGIVGRSIWVSAVPATVVGRLHAAIAKAVALPETRERYVAMGLDPSPLSPQDYGTYLREDVQRWRKVVAAAKLPPQ